MSQVDVLADNEILNTVNDGLTHIVWIDEDPNLSLCGLDMTGEIWGDSAPICKACEIVEALEVELLGD